MTDKTAAASWIESTIHHHRAALLLGSLTIIILFPLASQPRLRGLALTLGALIVPSQVCLIALWASLAAVPFLDRIGRTVLWTGGLYFCILGAAAIHADAVDREFPFGLGIAMCGLFAGTFLVALAMRKNGWRLFQSPDELASLSAARTRPMQFHLADLLRWVTTVCVFLALGAATIPRFAEGYALHSYGPGAEAIMESLSGAVCVACPLGALAAGTFWLVMGIEDFGAAFRLASRDPLTWIVLLWSFIIAAVLSCTGGGGSAIVVLVLIGAVGFAGPMASGSLFLRGLGYRLKRLPKQPASVEPRLPR
jgi:hypothetical protein